MKIAWGQLGIAVVALAVLAGICRLSPALRAAFSTQTQEWLGWTEDARRADPDGFGRYVERKLKTEVEGLQKCRFELVGNADGLAGKVREQQALRDRARTMAEEFRGAFQQARQDGKFPITVRNAAYTEDQAVSQVSLLLAEADGFDRTLRRLENIQVEANKRLEEIVVRLNATQSHLAAIGTQRELLRSRQMTTEGEELIAELDQLFDVNERLLANNPVRSVVELLEDERRGDDPALANHESARRFLEETPVRVGKPPVSDAAEGTDKVEKADKLEKTDVVAVETRNPVANKTDEASADLEVEFDSEVPPVAGRVIQEQSPAQDSPVRK